MRPALSLPDGMSPCGRTHNMTLRYKHLERPAHRASRERQNTRYFFFADACTLNPKRDDPTMIKVMEWITAGGIWVGGHFFFHRASFSLVYSSYSRV